MKPLLLALASFAVGYTAEEARQREPTRMPSGYQALLDQRYGDDPAQQLTIYRPRDATHLLPLVVWIHGGGWKGGTRAQCSPAMALVQLDPQYVVASIDYRLSGQAIFPAQIEDCALALAWLQTNASRFGIDPERIAVWGSSAGGHLAALAGMSGGTKWGKTTMPTVRAVVDWYGPTDLIAMSVEPGYERHGRADSAESQLLGGVPSERAELVRRANPITYVDAKDPPVLIAHGDHDRVVPPSQSTAFLTALTAAGVPAELRVVAGGGHGGPAFAAPAEIAAVQTFLSLRLGSAADRAVGKPK
jgi:acetyl esterase/lipase